jgi:segregation and condensation protein B
MNETEAPEAIAETAEASEAPRRETSAEKILASVEAVLFSSPKPVKEKDLADLLEAAPRAVADALASLAARYDGEERGIRVEKVAGGWRFVTRPEFDALLRKFHEVTERSRLSLAALETLAIIAYRQPITLPEIQEIRGVNSSSVLKTLFEKKLITTAGKKPVVGTPFYYRTTQDFLVRFGLNELTELPKPEDLDADLAATLEAREIAAPTATLSAIHVESGIAPGGEERAVGSALEMSSASDRLPGPSLGLAAAAAGRDTEADLEDEEDAGAEDEEDADEDEAQDEVDALEEEEDDDDDAEEDDEDEDED